MSVFPEGLEPVHDLRPADWVVEALKDWPRRPFEVRDLIPPVFDAYARILHHPWRRGDVRDPTGRWNDRAASLGLPLTRETRWDELSSSNDAWSLHPDGVISEGELSSLTQVIGHAAPGTSKCLFAIWVGFGFLDQTPGSAYLSAGGPMGQRLAVGFARMRERIAQRRAKRRKSTFRTFRLLNGNRSYLLIPGVLEDAIRLHRQFHFQPPTLWWPDERSWFIHTEIDSTSTFLGGSRALIDGILGEPDLESFEVEADTAAGM